eukprot:gene40015-54102_t
MKRIKPINLRNINPEEILRRKWTQPKPLNPTIHHNTLCEFCSGLVGGRNSDCTLMCIYCNVVVHKNCLMIKRRSFLSPASINDHIDKTCWVCFYCIESLHDSEMKFEQEQSAAKNYQIMVKAQTVI